MNIPHLGEDIEPAYTADMEVQYTRRLTHSPALYPNEIRSYRLKAGLSQRRLGVLIGRGRTSVSAWESGQRLPTLPSVFALARELSTLAEQLYYDLYRPKRREDDRETAPSR